jgi:hypothetical protein
VWERRSSLSLSLSLSLLFSVSPASQRPVNFEFWADPAKTSPHMLFGGEKEGGGVRSGPGAARTILLFHIISARPSKQPRMVRTFLKYVPSLRYTRALGWHIHCGVEVTESSTN